MVNTKKSIFISHAAAPIDSELTRWLALRLMREGYAVWCDLEKLRVGDDFWKEIENEIRNKSIKFLLILSRTSIARQGVLNELGVASKIAKHQGQRFILPARVDGLPYDDFPIEVNRLDAADFSKNWTVGFDRLLQILKDDGVPKTEDGPQTVLGWWQKRFPATEGVVPEKEEYSSNRFQITAAPKWIYLHALDDLKPFEKSKFKPPYPVHQIGGLFVSFASADDLAESFEKAEGKIGATFSTKLTTFLTDGYTKPTIERREARNIVVRLLKLAFQKKVLALGLLPYELASKESYYWFPPAVIAPRKQVSFARLNGTEGKRALVGSKTVKDITGVVQGEQQWHFGVEAIPMTWPHLGYHFRSHVAFSLNGALIADSKKQHRLRRRECKLWFNDRWADMLQAALAHLAAGQSTLDLDVGKDAQLKMSTKSESFISPVKFRWEKEKELPPYQPDDETASNEVLADDDDSDEEDFDE